jgi:hypothetical protein
MVTKVKKLVNFCVLKQNANLAAIFNSQEKMEGGWLKL